MKLILTNFLAQITTKGALRGIDKITFQSIFEQYYNPLCNFALGYLSDHSKAEDVVQDVFVKFWMKRDVIEADNNVKSYLFQSTKNRALEILRRNKLDQGMKEVKLAEANKTTDLDQLSNDYMLKEKLIASVRQLPPKCQQVFSLAKLNGLTYVEIAEEMEISVKTVENQMGRALRLLREKLSK